MTDDHGDAPEAGTTSLDEGIDDGSTDAVLGGSTASIANRIDGVQGTMSTLGMRIDALVTSTTSYRSALSDRLTEYAEMVNKATRSQASELEEYRRSTERTVAEVRRAVTTMDEGIARLATRLDDLVLGQPAAEGDTDGRRVIGEIRGILDAQERLSGFVTASLDKFSDVILDQLTSSNDRVLSEIGSAIETLRDIGSRDLTAGLREDVAQLRAMVGALGELDVRPVIDDLRADLASVRGVVDHLVAADPNAPVQAAVEPLAAALDRISGHLDAAGTRERSAHEQLIDRLAGLADGIDSLAAADHVSPIEVRLSDLDARIAELAGAVRDQTAEAVAVVDARVGVIASEVRREVDAVIAPMADTSRTDRSLAELREALLDVASGEVVGALWDELRSLRDALEDLPGAAVESPAVAALEAAIAELTSEVRTLLAAAEVPTDGAFADELVVPDDLFSPITEGLGELRRDVTALRAELADGLATEPVPGVLDGLGDLRTDLRTLRAELADGLAVEPAPALLDALATLHSDLSGLPDAVAALPEIQAQLDDLRQVVTDALEQAAVAAPPGPAQDEWLAGDQPEDHEHDQVTPAGPDNEAVVAELHAVRDAIEQVHARLEEGLVFAEDDMSPAGGAVTVAVADEIASVRDLLAAEFDTLRTQLRGEGPRGDAATTGEGESQYATVDPDVIDLLREEIRRAGSVSDEVVEAVREELKALRRRLSVKAQEKVLSDEQLTQIADIVAARLSK